MISVRDDSKKIETMKKLTNTILVREDYDFPTKVSKNPRFLTEKGQKKLLKGPVKFIIFSKCC